MANSIIKELRALAAADWNPQQKAFFQAQVNDAIDVKCVPMIKVLGPQRMEFLRAVYHPECKQCYKNAAILVRFLADYMLDLGPAYYVEGFVYDKRFYPIEHAFVRVGDKYIDPTFEMCLNLDVTSQEYVALGQWDCSTLWKHLAKTRIYGNVWRDKYIERMQKHKTEHPRRDVPERG